MTRPLAIAIIAAVCLISIQLAAIAYLASHWAELVVAWMYD